MTAINDLKARLQKIDHALYNMELGLARFAYRDGILVELVLKNMHVAKFSSYRHFKHAYKKHYRENNVLKVRYGGIK